MPPQSRGEVRLNSVDSRDKPNLADNFLSHTERAAQTGGRRTPPAPPSAVTSKANCPGEDNHSQAQIEQWVRQNPGTVFHPVGTCKMGHDPLAVVDDQLRRHGIDALRVVDVSIMPALITGNSNAPARMIA